MNDYYRYVGKLGHYLVQFILNKTGYNTENHQLRRHKDAREQIYQIWAKFGDFVLLDGLDKFGWIWEGEGLIMESRMSDKYMISGDGTGKTYGIYKINDGEVLPSVNCKPVVKGMSTFKDCQKWIANKEKE